MRFLALSLLLLLPCSVLAEGTPFDMETFDVENQGLVNKHVAGQVCTNSDMTNIFVYVMYNDGSNTVIASGQPSNNGLFDIELPLLLKKNAWFVVFVIDTTDNSRSANYDVPLP